MQEQFVLWRPEELEADLCCLGFQVFPALEGGEPPVLFVSRINIEFFSEGACGLDIVVAVEGQR